MLYICPYAHLYLFVYYTVSSSVILYVIHVYVRMYFCICVHYGVYSSAILNIIYMSVCTSVSVCILYCIKHSIIQLMHNVFKCAPACFGSHRIHHQGALYSAWLKITYFIISVFSHFMLFWLLLCL